MYDVLIVDDERVARESLKYLIEWEPFGFRIAGEAEDGLQALEQLKNRHYALVLTDIRMPRMNGLEMIAAMRSFSEVPVIIMSGYEDFDYAREGIKMGVQDYLLKPVDEDDLISVLRRLGRVIADKHMFERQHHLGMHVLRDQFLRSWCHGQLTAKEYGEQTMLLGLPSEPASACCLLVEMDFVYGTNSDLSEREMALKRFAVRNILEELCEGCGFVFEESEERYGIILLEVEEPAAADWAARMAASAARYAKETLTIGVGIPAPDVMAVCRSFAAAENALDGKFLRGHNSILRSLDETTGQSRQEDAALRKLQDEVMEAMHGYNRERVSSALERLWAGFREQDIGAESIRAAVLHLLVQLYQWVKQIGAEPGRMFGQELGDYERVMRVKTMEELLRFAEQKCMKVLEHVNSARELQPNKVIGAVKRIVREQYAANVSLRSVAEQVYLNPNYLGKLFKTATELSFNDYLLKVRMEKAKELLLGTDKKVYEIAQEIGYGELDWFYKRFKAYTGVSAGEYRSHFSAGSEGSAP